MALPIPLDILKGTAPLPRAPSTSYSHRGIAGGALHAASLVIPGDAPASTRQLCSGKFFLVAYHGIQDSEQFPGDSDESDLSGRMACTDLVVERLEAVPPARCSQSSHVKSMPHPAPAAGDTSPAFQGA